MKPRLRFRRKVAATTLGLAALGGSQVATADPAGAIIWWDAPPTCFTGAEWHRSNGDDGRWVLGLYEHVGQREERHYYGPGYEIRYIWVYEVQYPFYLEGLVTVGRAEKLCGAEYVFTGTA